MYVRDELAQLNLLISLITRKQYAITMKLAPINLSRGAGYSNV